MKTFQLAILFTIILAFMITYFQEPRGLSTQEPDTLTVPLTFAEPPEHADGKRIFKQNARHATCLTGNSLVRPYILLFSNTVQCGSILT